MKYSYKIASTTLLSTSSSAFVNFINKLGADGYMLMSAKPIIVKRKALASNTNNRLCTEEGFLVFMREEED